MEREIEYWVTVHPPENVQYNWNVTLHFKVEKASMMAGESGWDDVFIQVFGYMSVDSTTAYTNFTPPGHYRNIRLTRKISYENVKKQKLDKMPGFRFTWWYSGEEVIPEKKFKDEENNKNFVRYTHGQITCSPSHI